MTWENILKIEKFRNPFKSQKKGRRKEPLDYFQRNNFLSDENMKIVRQKIKPLTKLYKQKVPEYEANEESTLWIISTHLKHRGAHFKGNGAKEREVIIMNTIDEIIKDLTEGIYRKRGR
jgi:hypothetical protein